jgi:hypothetical protein
MEDAHAQRLIAREPALLEIVEHVVPDHPITTEVCLHPPGFGWSRTTPEASPEYFDRVIVVDPT